MNSRKRIKKGSVIVTILILIGLVFGSLYVFNEYFKKNIPEDKPTELNKDDETLKTYSSSFTLAGNVLLNDGMWKDGLKEKDVYDFSNMVSVLKESMKKSNINFYSEQSIIGGAELGMSSFSTFNAPKEIGDAMTSTGFNMVSLASYHGYDKGTTGIENSIKYWGSKAVVYSGMSVDAESRLKNNTIVKNGVSYTLLSYTMSTDIKPKETYSINIYSEELVKSDIEEVKNKTDVIIVSIDWGTNKTTEVSEKQKEVVNYLIKEGANVIIGNNGLGVQPIEIIDNTLVCYSLGNLLSAHSLIDSRISAIVDFNLLLTKKGETKTIEFKDISVNLAFAYNKSGVNYKVIPFASLKDELKDYKTYYEKYKTLLTKDKDYIKVYPIGE